MTTAKKILEMIENVSPDDSDKLDEIDLQVACFLNPKVRDKIIMSISFMNDDIRYTRSRDALKAIRPDFFEVSISNKEIDWVCELDRGDVKLESRVLPTEELAELHAIIQSISFEKEAANKENGK